MFEKLFGKRTHSDRPIPGKENYRKIKVILTKRPWLTVSIAIGILVLLSTQVRSIFAVLALTITSILSKLPQVLFPFVVVLDTIVFLVVVLTKAYGPGMAIVLGLIAYYTGTMLNSMFKNIAAETYVGPPIGYVLTVILVSFLPFDILTTGMIATAFYSLLMMAFYWALYHDIFNELTFIATILPFNYWLFSTYGDKVLALLGA